MTKTPLPPDPFGVAGLSTAQIAAACAPGALRESVAYLKTIPKEEAQAIWDKAAERADETLQYTAIALLRASNKESGTTVFKALFGDVPTGKVLEEKKFNKSFDNAHYIWVNVYVQQRKAGEVGAD